MTSREQAQAAIESVWGPQFQTDKLWWEDDALVKAVAEAIEQAALDMRERCAKVADGFDCDSRPLPFADFAADIAQAIREMKP